ncbi:GH92 family glycosyl hydrolase [Flavobacteriaceae bacterium F89]|uniref:GH92 family glycosyl hydrolase n=1 Tax=Cerina litoralis TaxID=2874477 RepID=A0AAE3EYU2_9FLAO|nr:GH92 family glycosyl hydrolase [Cerina litoralis]MCG2462843.1 GH92 family glycosyl hydrolase [Cerina litoralis]
MALDFGHMTFRLVSLRLFVVFILLLSFSSKGQTIRKSLLWNIGVSDSTVSEFALAPNDYKEFVPKGFGGAHKYYVVERSTPSKDFPYILPGPKDDFAGYGYWAGLSLTKLPIYFEISNLPNEGKCQLNIDFLAVSGEEAPLFRCTVNGIIYEHQLTNGESKNPENLIPNPQRASFSIPVSVLKEGVNEIVFQNMTGNWCAFDGINFLGPSVLQIKSPGSSLVHSVAFSDFEIVKGKENILPLMIDIRHLGKRTVVAAVVDGVEKKLPMEEGHSILEFEFPSVHKEKISDVKVFVNGNLKFENKLKRVPREEIALTDYVDQFMGTSGSRWMIAPGPWMPMGMVKIAPDNEDSKWKAGYEYQVENIMGFSHVHEWTMAGLLMMPTNGPLKIQPGPENNPDLGYRSRINKNTEKAAIGKYAVDLTDYSIHAELTATTRASMQRYTFPVDRENRVLIDLHFPAEYVWELRDAEIKRISDTEIVGRAVSHCSSTGYPGEQDYTLHFVVQFDTPMENMGGWVQDRIVENTDLINKRTYSPGWSNYLNHFKVGDMGAFINFPKGIKQVRVRTGISLISTDQARLNLEKEMTGPFGWDFEEIVQHQKNIWNTLLGRIEIQTPDYLQKVKFYTNFYRALSPRNTWNDVNGKWMDMDEKVQQADPARTIYGSDGYWGWQWNLVQFYNLIMPEYSSNWVNTYLEMYDKGRWLPRGNPGIEYFKVMPGQPEIPLMVAAYQHGIRDYDVNKMMEAIYHQQTAMPMAYPGGGVVGNGSYKYYLKRGYVPLNKDNQSYVSNTLEYAYQDWCVAQLAKSMQLDTIYRPFIKRSENWRNVFDTDTGFVRPRNMDGSWYKDFSPFHSPGFCESNSWQYSWYVPQNLPGVIDLMGKKRFVERLNKGMEKSEKVYFNALGDNFSKYPINHGNESNMQSSYLFNYANEPWLTQKWTRAIQERYYGMGPRDAYPGDEDQGQMSAWYVMSALGLFQMDGGASVDPNYELGSPRFERVTIHLSGKYYGGKTFVIEAKDASLENKYIHSAILNGKELDTWRFPQKELIKGGELILEMKEYPRKKYLKGN